MEAENKVSYYRDCRHNYMILPCTGAEKECRVGYQYRMLAVNRVSGLLPCSLRCIDGEGCFYYDITSRHSIGSIWQNGRIGSRELQNLLRALIGLENSLAEYLLNYDCVLLSPEFIFCDLEHGTFSFTYKPEKSEQDPCGTLQELAEFLVLHVDEEDKAAAACAYRFCTLAADPAYLPEPSLLEPGPGWDNAREEIPETLGTDGEEDNSDGVSGSAESMRYGKIESRESAGNREEEPERMQEESEPVNGESDGTDCTERKRKRGDSAGGVGAAITVTLIAMGCALAMFRFRSLAAPGGKNYLLYTGIMAACLAVSVIAAFSGTVLSRRADKSRKKETDGSAGEAPRPFCEYTAEAAQKPSAGQKDADPFGTAQYPYDDSYDAGRGPAAEEETTDCDFVGRLYGTESNSRKYRIDLGTLPCTVGRAPGYSDKILGDPSVSGVHARFFRREADGTVAVQDLNSGSGTYINGQRLLPNASGEILPGDEIRIGRLCFCYR